MGVSRHVTTIEPRATGIGTFHGVRYIVRNVANSVAFYTERLGFKAEHQRLPVFATVVLGELSIHLSGPGASGSRVLADGKSQEPGGSNRVIIRVETIEQIVDELRDAGVPFRNDLEAGPAGKQIQILDPDGNPIELFEPAH